MSEIGTLALGLGEFDTSTAVTGTTSNEAAASYNHDVSHSMHIAMDEAPFTIDVCVPAHLYY